MQNANDRKIGAVNAAQGNRGEANQKAVDQGSRQTDHTMKPGDGTLPGDDQVSTANNYGASQEPQEEFISSSSRDSNGELGKVNGHEESSQPKPEGDQNRTPEGP